MRRLTPLCVGIVLVMSAVVRASIGTINEQLEALEENVRLAMIETYTAWEEVGQTVVFDDRVLQLGHHFVPGDPRRGGFDDIAWLSDLVDGTATGLSQVDTQIEVSDAMITWDGVSCSTIPLTELPDYGLDWGVTQWLAGFGGVPFSIADITHAGWLPREFFDVVFSPDEGDDILGATFTFVWIDEDDEFTDIDNNGKLDVAFRETYYNNYFTWGIGPAWPTPDVETVVLHETGHGLSQGHFGKLFRTDANGKFHFSPRAVMNAGFTGVQQDLTGTDIGGHCSIWGAWPGK